MEENIEYKKDSHLALKDICQKVGVKEKSKLKRELEKIIQLKFSNINFLCQRTTLNGEPFQGWFDITFKEL